MRPRTIARPQATFTTEPGSFGGTETPQAVPRFGSLGSLRSREEELTPSQRRGLE